MKAPNNWKALIDEATKHEAITLVNAFSNQTEEKQGKAKLASLRRLSNSEKFLEIFLKR